MTSNNNNTSNSYKSK